MGTLRFETDNPEKNDSPEYTARHCIAEAREGYALPPLEITTMGSYTRLTWERERLDFHGLEFLEAGVDHADSTQVLSALSDFVNAVVGRLDALGIEETLLQDEWGAVQDSDSDEVAFCAAAAALGVDPYAATATEIDTVLHVAEQLPRSLVEEFLWVSDPDSAVEQASELAAAIGRAQSQHVSLSALRELRSEGLSFPGYQQPPWTQGFGLARRLRERLSLDGEPLPSLSELAGGLNIDEESLDSTVERAEMPTYLIDGLVAENQEESPSLILRPRAEEAIRFHLCRGIAEYLTSGSAEPAILTRAGSERQARNRAFAAEFLAPSEGLRSRIKKTRLNTDDIDEIAEVFGVSSAVIFHQVRNHEIAEILPPGP